MTRLEMNEEVALACGWKKVSPTVWWGAWTSPDGHNQFEAPNFAGDLNLMWQAEEKADWTVYPSFLLQAAAPGCFEFTTAPVWKTLHATALQRAEAFLRAKGKWRE